MKEYRNPWPHTVDLLGPNGERIRIKSGVKKSLDDFYDRYVLRGYIEVADQPKQIQSVNIQNAPTTMNARTQQVLKTTPIIQPQIQPVVKRQISPNVNHLSIKPLALIKTTNLVVQNTKTTNPVVQNVETIDPVVQNVETILTPKNLKKKNITNVVDDNRPRLHKPDGILGTNRKIVGRTISGDATNIYKENSAKAPYRISDGVGIGILSYNRGKSLLRLVESIKNTVDLNKTTLFISDDCSSDQYTLDVLAKLEEDNRIVVIRNDANIGISGNSNRLLRCLSRFQHMFLCNDDVEFLQAGWISFYIKGAMTSDFHHFCFRQPKIYGAKIGEERRFNDVKMYCVANKPHGAMLYISNLCLKTVGYFDTSYDKYGMEHVDWSMKPAEFNLQPIGFYDLDGSIDYIRIHPETSAVENKTEYYNRNKAKFENRTPRLFIKPDAKSFVPKISYVIPCRDIDRSDSIKSVIMGVIGQSFPEIEIWLVEQDIISKIGPNKYPNINYIFVDGNGNSLFNKSMAFNNGVDKCTSDCVILHDADMLSRVDYTKRVYELLKNHESLHICGRVIYMNDASTNRTNAIGSVEHTVEFERIVGYFEGGSLACRRSTYWKYGGFNQDYWGYGVEDCDFFLRISNTKTWLCTNEFDLIHLWHGRTDGWNDHHKQNKIVESKLLGLTTQQRISLQLKKLVENGFRHNL